MAEDDDDGWAKLEHDPESVERRRQASREIARARARAFRWAYAVLAILIVVVVVVALTR